MNYQETIKWLYATQQHGIKLGLENVRKLLQSAEVDLAGGGIRYIHVAGTNGKGSVCAMLEAICRQAEMRTGLFTSPHLVEFRERIRVNGEEIPEAEVIEGLALLREVAADWSDSPTFFEYTTVLALRYFQKQKVEVAVMEVGMGGRLDSTNVIRPVVSVITPIDLDHQRWLGHEIEDIANEKAGIIKPDLPAVSARQSERAAATLAKVARVRSSPLTFIETSYHGRVALAGEHQRDNAALAIAALKAGALAVSEAEIEAGLASVNWKGRFQRLEPALILDGAHNPGAMKTLARHWQVEFPERKATVIFGVLKDKDIMGILRELGSFAAEMIVVPVRSPRRADPREVSKLVSAVLPHLPQRCAKSLPEALEQARQAARPILITGSLFLVGEALAHFGHGSSAVMESDQ